MFRKIIQTTELTSDVSQSMFPNINGECYRGDCSFLASLRALLPSRMSEGDSVYLGFKTSSYYESDLTGMTTKNIISKIVGSKLENGEIRIITFDGNDAGNALSFKTVKDHFVDEYGDGFVLLEKISAFFKKAMDVVCYIDSNKKRVLMFVTRLDTRKMHYLQMGILPMLPWYFNPERGDTISENEMALIQSLREREADKYIAAISKIAEQYDFRSAFIRHELFGFESRYDRIKMDNVRNMIDQIDRRLREYRQVIVRELSSREEQVIKLYGLESKIEKSSEDSEIMEYFLCNKALHLEQVSDDNIIFSVATYLSYFDKDAVESIIGNKRSFLYRSTIRETFETVEQMVDFIKAIFLDETLKIRFCAGYRFGLSGYVEALTDHCFPDSVCNYMPNPHINRYRCMGNYERIINERLADFDYIGALEQCIASCKSLNWYDTTVMEKFMSDICRDEFYCVELPDGRVVKPSEAARWLKENEHEQEKKEEA